MSTEFGGGGSLLPSNGSTQRVARALSARLDAAARQVDKEAFSDLNLVVGENVAEPAVTVASPGAQATVDAADALLVAEVLSPGGEIKRPLDYARAGIPYYLRVELRGDPPRPMMALDELVDGRYQLVCAAPAGTQFVMHRPFEFEVDPAELIER